MKITPAFDRIAVKLVERRQVGSIVLPEIAQKDRAVIAEVVGVGGGKLKDDGSLRRMTYAVGQKVLINRFKGITVPESEDCPELIILEEEDVLGVVTE